MKKCRYALWDSVVVLFIWVYMVIYMVYMRNWLMIAAGALASVYFVPKSVNWFFILLDYSGGEQTKGTVFDGVAEEGTLDVFYKVRYAKICFDDESLKCGFTVFYDAAQEDIRRGDKVIIHYFPRSKIVTEMIKVRTDA